MRPLLRSNPAWIWRHEIGIPMQDGFLNKWRAKIPVGKQLINITGACTVQLRDGLIYRNEVYFDTYALLKAIAGWKTR